MEEKKIFSNDIKKIKSEAWAQALAELREEYAGNPSALEKIAKLEDEEKEYERRRISDNDLSTIATLVGFNLIPTDIPTVDKKQK